MTASTVPSSVTDHARAGDRARASLAALRKRRRTLQFSASGGFVFLFAMAACLPLLNFSDYIMTVATLILMWVGLSLSWNLLSGLTGYVSFGHACLFGLGTYTVGIGVTRYHWSLAFAILVAFVGVGAVSLVFGAITLRLQGHYFAIATLGISEAVRIMVQSNRGYTGGTTGFQMPTHLFLTDISTEFYWMLAILAVTLVISVAVLWSAYGERLLTIREDETAARSVGINVAWHKVSAFALSGALTATFGGMYAWVLGYLSPDAVFTPTISLQISLMAIIGGMGTIVGPIIGGIAFYILGEYSLASSPNLHWVIVGSALIFAMLFLRNGVWGTLTRSRFWPSGFRI